MVFLFSKLKIFWVLLKRIGTLFRRVIISKSVFSGNFKSLIRGPLQPSGAGKSTVKTVIFCPISISFFVKNSRLYGGSGRDSEDNLKRVAILPSDEPWTIKESKTAKKTRLKISIPLFRLLAMGYVASTMGTAPRNPDQAMKNLSLNGMPIPIVPRNTAAGLETKERKTKSIIPFNIKPSLNQSCGETSTPNSTKSNMLDMVDMAEEKL